MKFPLRFLLILNFLIALSSPSSADELRVGVAEVDVTPPGGVGMSGYYHERFATGSKDPLKAKAVVFRQGDVRAAFVVCDLIGISRDLYVAAGKRASEQTGIPTEHIVISATHSHTAPDYRKLVFDYLAAPDAPTDKPPYASQLIEGVASAIVAADVAATPVTLSAGSAMQETPVSFNRRSVMADGSVQTWQAASNPHRVRAAGPIDPQIGLLLIQSRSSEKPTALVSNFALHLDTVGGTEWSADYPYFIEQSLRKQFGPDFISVFGAGTCGDINHSNPEASERNTTAFIGNALATTIESALPELLPVEDATFQVHTTTVDLPLQDVGSPAEIERASELIRTALNGAKVDFFDHVRAYKAIMLDHLHRSEPLSTDPAVTQWAVSHALAGVGAALPVDVTTMTLGRDLAIVFLPGEVFVDLGLAIKQASPFRTTLVIELSNCVETYYIPTRAAYAGGSYEVTNSQLQPGGGEMLVEAAVQLLRESASIVK